MCMLQKPHLFDLSCEMTRCCNRWKEVCEDAGMAVTAHCPFRDFDIYVDCIAPIVCLDFVLIDVGSHALLIHESTGLM